MGHRLQSLFSLFLSERVGERACLRQALHPPLTAPKGRGRNHALLTNLETQTKVCATNQQ